MNWTDFHCHILPAFDDGAPSTEVSRLMVRRAVAQDVSEIVATPHYKYTNESPASFAIRRDTCLESLRDALQDEKRLPSFCVGAEIMLTATLDELDLSPLIIGKYNAMLLELPFTGYRSWMAEAIENLALKYQIIPVLAHFERYPEITEKQLPEILSIPRLVIQFNNTALRSHPALCKMRRLLADRVPVILGSDAHNDTDRPLSFDTANTILKKRTLFNRSAYDVLQTILSYGATIPSFDGERALI